MFVIENDYLCVACNKINVIEPYQSGCGCRFCEICIKLYDVCPSCFMTLQPYRYDKGFKRDLEKKKLKCSMCEWYGKIVHYPRHCIKSHKYAKCKVCGMIVEDVGKHTTDFEMRHCEIIAQLCREINVRKQLEEDLLLQQSRSVIVDEIINNDEGTPKNGVLLWKITSFDRRLTEAKTERLTSFYSPSFHTSEHGYKLCARVYLNGDREAKDTHLSLFIVIMKGPCDNLLNWPFSQKVTFTIIDQSAKQHFTKSLIADPYLKSCSKPAIQMNPLLGISLFCPHTTLSSPYYHYIRDDCMFIKIVIGSENF